MAHADHFLQRLGRIEAATEVDFALGLYRDRKLLRYVLGQVRLPEGTERVALALKEGTRGPFIIVDREGRFITCLGEGMQHDLPVIQRQHLDHVVGKAQTTREQLLRSQQLVKESGGIKTVIDRLLTAGASLGREEYEAFSVWQPLIRETLVKLFFKYAVNVSEGAPKIRGLLRQKITPSKRARIHKYSQRVWALSHLALLLADDDRSFLQTVFDEIPHVAYTLPYCAFNSGVAAIGLRGAWAAAKLGHFFLDQLDFDEPQSITVTTLIGVMLSLTATGIRHRKLRGRARATLARLGTVARRNEVSALTYDALIGLTENAMETHEAGAEKARRHSTKCLFELGQRHPEVAVLQFSSAENVPDEIALAYGAVQALPYTDSIEYMPILIWTLCWAARARAEELYLPTELARTIFEPWHLEQGLMILRGIDIEDGPAAPLRAKPKPGRNQPCSCGSGRKYKRCCGSLVDSAAS